MYTRPILENGEVPTFGVSGKLWRSSLVMYDRQTRSLWSQVQGRSIAGSLLGTELEKIAAQQTTWAEWRAQHPQTLVMVKPPIESSVYSDYASNNGRIGLFYAAPRDRRLPPKELVYGLKGGGAVLAVPLALLEKEEVVSAELGEDPVLIVSRRSETTVRAFERRLKNSILSFEKINHEGMLRLRDAETGSLWDPATGEAVTGERIGQRLEPVAGTLVYWDFWSRHHPGVRLLGEDEL